MSRPRRNIAWVDVNIKLWAQVFDLLLYMLE